MDGDHPQPDRPTGHEGCSHPASGDDWCATVRLERLRQEPRVPDDRRADEVLTDQLIALSELADRTLDG